MNVISLGECVFQSLQHNDTDTVAHDRSLRARVERTAVTVWRKDSAIAMTVSDALWHTNGDPSRKRHITLIGQKVLASRVNGNKRCRAGRLYQNAGTPEVELVRYTRCQIVLFVCHDELLQISGPANLGIHQEV